MTELSTEGALLLSCGQRNIDDATKANIESLSRLTPKWEPFKHAAIRNQVVPFVYRALRDSCPEQLPPSLLDEFAEHIDAMVAKSERNLLALLELLQLFESNNVPVIPFKGLTFAWFVYGDLTSRPCGDIDLLVHREDFMKAGDILIRANFMRGYFGHAETSQLQTMYARSGVVVDLHYGLTPFYHHTNMQWAREGSSVSRKNWNRLNTETTYWFFSLDTKPLWDRLGSVTIDGKTIPTLGPEDLLLVAVIHGFKDNWRILRRVTDLADLIHAQPTINWDDLMNDVRDLGCERKFLLALVLVQTHCSAPIPNGLSEKACDSATRRSLAKQILYRASLRNLSMDHEEFKLLVNLFTMDSISALLRYLRYIVRRWCRNDRIERQSFLRKLLRQILIAFPRALAREKKAHQA